MTVVFRISQTVPVYDSYIRCAMRCGHEAKFENIQDVSEARRRADEDGWLCARSYQEVGKFSPFSSDSDVCPQCLTEWVTRRLERQL